MFEVYYKVAEIPNIWDEIVGNNPFLKRKILQQLEKLNPCKQAYHINIEKKIALVSYKLKIDLFTFTKSFTLKIPLNIIGIPLSVSKCGYAVKGEDGLIELSKYITTLKGFYVVLNGDGKLKISRGNTLPTCKMELKWNNFNQYINNKRSSYRYRANKAIKKFTSIKVEELQDNKLFNEEMYSLYEKVFQQSKEKLEKLNIDFFRQFPAKIITFKSEKKTVGFVQLMENDEELIFLFGGFDNKYNLQYDLYMNMLLQIVRYAIEKGFKTIDFGQTAEETKTKLGALQIPKYMYLHHSNFLMKTTIKALVEKFSYKPYKVMHHVFKEVEDEGTIGKMP